VFGWAAVCMVWLLGLRVTMHPFSCIARRGGSMRC
jgi:hypothetical protein